MLLQTERTTRGRTYSESDSDDEDEEEKARPRAKSSFFSGLKKVCSHMANTVMQSKLLGIKKNGLLSDAIVTCRHNFDFFLQFFTKTWI